MREANQSPVAVPTSFLRLEMMVSEDGLIGCLQKTTEMFTLKMDACLEDVPCETLELRPCISFVLGEIGSKFTDTGLWK
jgi:hypothetical protein